MKNIDTGTYNDNYESYKEISIEKNHNGEVFSSKDTTDVLYNSNYKEISIERNYNGEVFSSKDTTDVLIDQNYIEFIYKII